MVIITSNQYESLNQFNSMNWIILWISSLKYTQLVYVDDIHQAMRVLLYSGRVYNAVLIKYCRHSLCRVSVERNVERSCALRRVTPASRTFVTHTVRPSSPVLYAFASIEVFASRYVGTSNSSVAWLSFWFYLTLWMRIPVVFFSPRGMLLALCIYILSHVRMCSVLVVCDICLDVVCHRLHSVICTEIGVILKNNKINDR